MTAFTQFERQVLEALLLGEDPLLRVLSKQLTRATVSDRSYSGIGCFVDIDLPDDVSGSTPRDILIRDIHVEVDDCDHGAAAILVVRNGRLAMLELVAYAGEWPPHPVLRGISYLSPDGPQHHRDMIEFGRMIAAEITVRESQ